MTINWDEAYASRAGRMGASEIRELLKILEQPDVISFAGGIPDPNLFPVEAFQQGFARALGMPAEAERALQYSVSEGAIELREWIAGYMKRMGVDCTPANILITCGSQQALEFLGRLFIGPNDPALVTWPTYLGALQAFNAYEPDYARLDPRANTEIPAPGDGTPAQFAYVVPDFANPTGETLTLAERKRVLATAAAANAVVIEDGAYSALRYDGEEQPALIAIDCEAEGGIENSRVIYCGTFSKTLSPGLRVGWIVAAEPLIDKLVLVKQASDLHSATLNQMALTYVAETIFDTQVALVRQAYRTRRDAMMASLERHMPAGFKWSKPEGGMFVWMEGPKSLDARKLLDRAVMHYRVAFVPGQAFFADGSGAETMRLSFSLAEPAVIEEGVQRLARAIAAM
jgi:DNA-binding transcriptional MocR family regulator